MSAFIEPMRVYLPAPGPMNTSGEPIFAGAYRGGRGLSGSSCPEPPVLRWRPPRLSRHDTREALSDDD